MVLPDGTKSDQNRPGRSRALLFAVAALAIVAGFVALGSLSPSEQVAVDTTTTTTTIPEVEAPIDLENFSVSQIATGPPLEWERMTGSTRGYPITVTEHEGTFHLFASARAPTAPPGLNWLGSSDQGPAGLVTWRSENGENWERMGETVIDTEYQPQVRFSDVVGHHALLYTRDGTEWEIRDARQITGDESAVVLIEVGEGKLIATTIDPPVDPRQAPPTGFEIWTAPLP